MTDREKLNDLACCAHMRLATIYRGPVGCVEGCENCGFAFGYDADGKLTPETFAVLRARAHTSKETNNVE